MRLLVTFARVYPWQSFGVLVAMLLAGTLEGLSLTALLPVLSIAANRGEQPLAGSAEVSGASAAALRFVETLGIEPTLTTLLLAVIMFIVLRSAVMLVAMRGVGYMVAQVATDLRLELLRALLATRWEYFLRQPVGNLTNAVASEAARASMAYVRGAGLVTATLQFLVATVVALMVSWQATLVYVGAAIGISVGLRSLMRLARRAGKRQTKIMRALLASLTDMLQSIKPLKAMARSDVSDALLQSQTLALNKAMRREVISKETLRAIQDPAFAVLIAFAAWVGLVQWELPFAEVGVMMLLLARVLGGLKKMQSSYQEMVTLESAYWALRETIGEAQAQVERTQGTSPPKLERSIRFDGVSFRYGETEVLHGCSFQVPAGSLTTLIGKSGAGKTTIVDLVIGLLQPTAGHLWIDDAALDSLDLIAWRRQIGYVPQENLLLHDSIRHNVTLGDPSLSDADVDWALQAAGAAEFVARMPQRADSPVGERGVTLSGGQRQRIMIARAIVHRPRLLILDEATSALDRVSAEQLAATLGALRGSMTILAISHQPDLVEVADRIYHVEKGRAELADSSSHASAPRQTEPI